MKIGSVTVPNPVQAVANIADIMSAGVQYHEQECHGHPYASRWYTWPVMEHPVLFYYVQTNSAIPDNPTVSSVTDLGNPAVWWLSILFGLLSAAINLPIVEKPVVRLAPD